jgi:hypothetical protein
MVRKLLKNSTNEENKKVHAQATIAIPLVKVRPMKRDVTVEMDIEAFDKLPVRGQ